MELHREFTYQPGLTFDFNGDDDVWVFVNNQLVLDIGGVHEAANDNFALDDYAEQLGLEQGKKYSFDFFYAERQTSASTIKITTNLLTPLTLELQVRNDTVSAGSLTRVDAVIRDSSGIRQPEKESQTTWQLLDPSAPGDTITNLAGASTELGGTRAYRRVIVKATYVDPEDPDYTLEGRAFVYVGPGPADHVWIEKLLSDSLTNSLNAPDTVERISVSLNEDSATAYAVLRDKYGNYVDLARSAQWSSESASKIGAKPTQGKKWIGIVSRGTGGQTTDSARITASQGGLKSDKAWAVVEFKLQVATPTIYPPGGDFAGSITVDSITSATDGAIIWYTTDGSDPEPYGSNTLRYSRGETITISNMGETIVKAIATHTDETRYNPSGIAREVYVNIDNVGPEISRVRYYLANPPGKTGNQWDTLIVRFNEPVEAAGLKGQSPSAVFSYFDFDDPGLSEDKIFSNWRYSDVTQRDLDTATAGVRGITILLGDKGLITPVEDSMQIKEGTVADRYGNPSPANGAKVKIEWGRDYSYVTKSAPNPFVPGVDEVPKVIRDNIDQSGTTEPIPKQATIVQVSSVTRLDPKGSYGYIYDAVGNQVSEKLSFFPTGKNSKQFYLFWDGRNRNNRFVSSGTYLAMIYIKEMGRDRVSIKRQKIGVKR
jgi:fibro-slime domain-containing protein